MLMDTTDPSYWLNWKFLLCATWVYSCMALACYLIWKYEGPSSPAGNADRVDAEDAQPRIGPGVVYLEDCWKPCLKQIHPGWLLAFRLVSFFTMASILTYDVVVDGWTVFLYYTQWTFLLVTLYFGVMPLTYTFFIFSLARCFQFMDAISMFTRRVVMDLVQIMAHISLFQQGKVDMTMALRLLVSEEHMMAGKLQDFGVTCSKSCFRQMQLLIGTHSINAVFIIGDTALNSLRFPWFRIAYFMMWTGIFVTAQWIIHANVSIWWPYPFLDLTYPGAPIWYLVVALLHLPCYGLFALVLRLKQSLLQRLFCNSYT